MHIPLRSSADDFSSKLSAQGFVHLPKSHCAPLAEGTLWVSDFFFLVTYQTAANVGFWDLLSTSPLCFAKSQGNEVETCAESFEENFSFSAEVVYTYDESQENGKRKRKYKLNGRNSENFNLNKVVTYKLKVRHYVNHSTLPFPFSLLPKISSRGF